MLYLNKFLCIRQFYIRGNTYRCLFGWTLDKLFVFVLLLVVIHDIQYMVDSTTARKCFQNQELGRGWSKSLPKLSNRRKWSKFRKTAFTLGKNLCRIKSKGKLILFCISLIILQLLRQRIKNLCTPNLMEFKRDSLRSKHMKGKGDLEAGRRVCQNHFFAEEKQNNVCVVTH